MTEWYRCHDWTADDGIPRFTIYRYRVLKETRCGVWLGVGGRKRFVLNDARKRFAYPTVSEAWESLHARRRRELSILTHRVEYVRKVLDDMKAGMPKECDSYSYPYWNDHEHSMQGR